MPTVLDRYDAADECANTALIYDPKSIKARFRRGLARKGSLRLAAAAVDFRAVLEKEPDLAEAKAALEDTLVLMRERNEEDHTPELPTTINPTTIDQLIRVKDDSKANELESLSDSSDCQHVGNGYPCFRYNHNGCTRGTQCPLSHAPNCKSLRDGLGRNVCLRFMLGICTYSDTRCVYAHETTYLRPDGWWDDSCKRIMHRNMVRRAPKDEGPEWTLYRLMELDRRSLWNSSDMIGVYEQVRSMARKPLAYKLRAAGDSRSKYRLDVLTQEELNIRIEHFKRWVTPIYEAKVVSFPPIATAC
ncbi:hypothetical protein BC834DRAFT_825660 [Gloeopeniophorella convolvens]|nr:hypothetical protein BC834DRAFT_825660 [Gloeopeniophorella convolvens]